MLIIAPFVIGLGVAALLWRKRWTATLWIALILLLLSTLAYGAVVFLPPKAYALIPLEGHRLTAAGWFLGVTGISTAMALLARLAAHRLNRRRS